MKNNMTTRDKLPGIIRLVVSITLIVYGIYKAFLPWYFTADAQCAVYNLQYMADCAKEAGIETKIDTKGLNRLKYPVPIALLELSDFTSNWTYAYLGGVELAAMQDENHSYKNANIKTNPHEALTHIDMLANTEANMMPYEIIKYHIAITNPETVLSHEILEQYLKTVTKMKEEMTETYKDYYSFFISSVYVGIFIVISTVFINIIISVVKRVFHLKKEFSK